MTTKGNRVSIYSLSARNITFEAGKYHYLAHNTHAIHVEMCLRGGHRPAIKGPSELVN